MARGWRGKSFLWGLGRFDEKMWTDGDGGWWSGDDDCRLRRWGRQGFWFVGAPGGLKLFRALVANKRFKLFWVSWGRDRTRSDRYLENRGTLLLLHISYYILLFPSCCPPQDQSPLWHEVRYCCSTFCSIYPSWLRKVVKPSSTALMRAGPCAFISSSSAKSATTEIQPSSRNDQPGGPPLGVTRKPRREVPLPSQEKKEGAMQYALYVPPLPPFSL